METFVEKRFKMESAGLSPIADLDSSSGGSDVTTHTLTGYVNHPHQPQGYYANNLGGVQKIAFLDNISVQLC